MSNPGCCWGFVVFFMEFSWITPFAPEAEPGYFHDLGTCVRGRFVDHLVDGVQGVANRLAIRAAEKLGDLFEADALLVGQFHTERLDRYHEHFIR